MNSTKLRRQIRKFKKLTAELYLSGLMSEKEYLEPKTTPASVPVLSSAETVRQQIRMKRKRDLVPKIHFNAERDYKKSVSVSELQNFIFASVLNSQTPVKPKFCQIVPWRGVSQTVVVLIDCESIIDFDDEFQFFRRIPFVSGNFLHRFYAKIDPIDFYASFFRVPISLMDRLRFAQKSDDSASETNGSEQILETKNPDLICVSNETKRGKTNYLMSMSDMTEDNYPIPDRELGNQTDFTYSMTAYDKVTDDSPVYAVDCEMCMTGPNRRELTRISVVDEKCNIVLDTLVKPKNKITDYLTRFSGITERMMKNERTTLANVQAYLKRILPSDAILCGHSLNFDLDSIRIYHPYSMDVSVLYNLSGNRKSRSSLRTLSQMFLGETIQNSATGHCSVEDAYATMKLLQLKFANGLQFGNVQMGWSYDEFAKLNKIDRCTGLRTKRKLPDEDWIEQNSSSKRSKLENVKNIINKSNCRDCGSTVEPNCRNDDCVCRRLSWLKCIGCLPNETDPEDDQRPSMIAPENVFIVPSTAIECAFDLFERRKKQLLWVSIRDEMESDCHDGLCKLATSSSSCRHRHVVNNDECIENFKSNLLENDLNVLEIRCGNSNIERMDAVTQEILQYSARNALVCLIFKQKNKAVCCLKIKR